MVEQATERRDNVNLENVIANKKQTLEQTLIMLGIAVVSSLTTMLPTHSINTVTKVTSLISG